MVLHATRSKDILRMDTTVMEVALGEVPIVSLVVPSHIAMVPMVVVIQVGVPSTSLLLHVVLLLVIVRAAVLALISHLVGAGVLVLVLVPVTARVPGVALAHRLRVGSEAACHLILIVVLLVKEDLLRVANYGLSYELAFFIILEHTLLPNLRMW